MVSASVAYAKLFFRTAKTGSERARVCVYLCIGQIQVDGRYDFCDKVSRKYITGRKYETRFCL